MYCILSFAKFGQCFHICKYPCLTITMFQKQVSLETKEIKRCGFMAPRDLGQSLARDHIKMVDKIEFNLLLEIVISKPKFNLHLTQVHFFCNKSVS